MTTHPGPDPAATDPSPPDRARRDPVADGRLLSGVVLAHSAAHVGAGPSHDRRAREAAEEALLAPGATRARGAGDRLVVESADPHRTCFERDVDRVQHSAPFRRLAGKCQVFVAPEDDHLRTRLTHAIEVAQVAESVARAVGLNVALTRAAALAHDCGHGPAGHASEEALSIFLADGYDHASYGADVTLAPLNLCRETLDAVRNHSWRRPAPATPEGEVVAWADRIAYVCHDFQDAVRAGIVTLDDLPADVADVVGTTKSGQLGSFVRAMVDTIGGHGVVGLRVAEADALAAFRAFNFERIYLRPASRDQAAKVIRVIRSLTEAYVADPALRPRAGGPSSVPGSAEAVTAAVDYVAGMTDRFLLTQAVEVLGWDPADLPRGA